MWTDCFHLPFHPLSWTLGPPPLPPNPFRKALSWIRPALLELSAVELIVAACQKRKFLALRQFQLVDMQPGFDQGRQLTTNFMKTKHHAPEFHVEVAHRLIWSLLAPPKKVIHRLWDLWHFNLHEAGLNPLQEIVNTILGAHDVQQLFGIDLSPFGQRAVQRTCSLIMWKSRASQPDLHLADVGSGWFAHFCVIGSFSTELRDGDLLCGLHIFALTKRHQTSTTVLVVGLFVRACPPSIVHCRHAIDLRNIEVSQLTIRQPPTTSAASPEESWAETDSYLKGLESRGCKGVVIMPALETWKLPLVFLLSL